MTHRTDTSPRHVREAHQHVGDGQRAATERVYQRQRDGETTQARDERREAYFRALDASGYTDPAPRIVQADIARSAVVPLALSRPCPTCGADAGVSCARAVVAACGARVQIGSRLRAQALT